MRKILNLIPMLFLCSCTVTAPKPLTYLAIEKPKKVVTPKSQKSVKKEFEKGGWYFWNNGFRPASNVKNILIVAHEDSGEKILKDADVRFEVPFAFDVLFFGYNSGKDVIANNDGLKEEEP